MRFSTATLAASLIALTSVQAVAIPQQDAIVARDDSSSGLGSIFGSLLGGAAPAASASTTDTASTTDAADAAGSTETAAAAAPSDPLSSIIAVLSNLLEGAFSGSGALLHNTIG